MSCIRVFNWCSLLVATFFLVSCGSSTPTPQAGEVTIGLYKFNPTANGLLATNELAEVASRTEYRFKATLETSKSVTLYSNCDAQLQNGVVITFEQQGDRLRARINEQEFAAVVSREGQELSLRVEVHNNEGHVMVWNSHDENAAPIAELEGGDALKGRGNRWGLSSNPSITSIGLAPAKEEH